MGNCGAFHLNAIGMRGLNRSVTHGVTRNKAVTRGDSATQELLGVLLRSRYIQ